MKIIPFINKIDYSSISPEQYGTFERCIIISFALIFTLALTFLYYLLNKKAVAVFKNMFPCENVVYVIKNPAISRFLITFFIGIYGGMLFVFSLVDNISSVGKINIQGMPLYIIIFLACIYALVLKYSFVFIISNKKICPVFPLKIKYLADDTGCLIKDIASITYKKNFIIEKLVLTLKNKQSYNTLIGFAKLKKVKQILDRLIG